MPGAWTAGLLMALSAEELERYLQRIGYPGSGPGPDLDTLQVLHRLHPQAIPFENLDSFSGKAVSLDPDAVFAKLVTEGRGGYCFEHNLLFMRVLKTLGFTVSGLSARVRWMRAEADLLPRTHKALLVELDGTPYLADVGFGGQTMTAALRLDSEAAQDSPHEPLQVSRDAGLYRVSSLVAGIWQPLYECSLEPFLPVDYETANWYVSTHPASRFVTNLICSRVDAGVRHVLLDRRHALYRGDGSSEVHEARSRKELEALLTDTFRINVAAAPASMQALDRLFEEDA